MAFTIGSSQLKKRFYNVYLDTHNNNYISKLIGGTKIHKMLKDSIDNLNETHLTDGATIGEESGLYVHAQNNSIDITIPASNEQSGIRFISVINTGSVIRINDVVLAKAFYTQILKDYSNNDDENLECSLLPLGAVLEGLTVSDSKGDERKLASGNTIVVSNNVSVNFTLAGLADELRGLIEDAINYTKLNVGLLFVDRFGDNHFYIGNINPFTSLNIVSNDIGQTEVTVEDERGLDFIRMLEE